MGERGDREMWGDGGEREIHKTEGRNTGGCGEMGGGEREINRTGE